MVAELLNWLLITGKLGALESAWKVLPMAEP